MAVDFNKFINKTQITPVKKSGINFNKFITTSNQLTISQKGTLPADLGGGSYNVGKNGSLVKTERDYGGIEAPGQYREHIFPVALGGTSDIDNIKVYGKDLGAKKTAYEIDIINQYKAGKLDLPEARGLVLKKFRELTGLDPKQGTIKNLPSSTAEIVGGFFKGLIEPLVGVGVGVVNMGRTAIDLSKALMSGNKTVTDYSNKSYNLPIYGKAEPTVTGKGNAKQFTKEILGNAFSIAPYIVGGPEAKGLLTTIESIGGKSIKDITAKEATQFAKAYSTKIAASSLKIGPLFGLGESIKQNANAEDTANNIVKTTITVAALEAFLSPIIIKGLNSFKGSEKLTVSEKVNKIIKDNKELIDNKVNEIKSKTLGIAEKPKIDFNKFIEQKKDITEYISEPKNPIEAGTFDYIKNNTNKAVQDYFKEARDYYGNDNIISADVAKKVIPNYRGELAGDFHVASSAIAKYVYDIKLKERKGEANNTVLFTSGGTGSGKSTAIKGAGFDLNDYSIVYDTNLSGLERSARKIQQAIDNGYKVNVLFVQREPITAFREGVIPRVAKENRIVNIDEHILRHSESFKTLEELKSKFGANIDIKYIDNTGLKGAAKEVNIDNLPKYKYNDNKLKEKLYEETNQALKRGQITEAEARGIRGELGKTVRGRTQQTINKGRTGNKKITYQPIKTQKIVLPDIKTSKLSIGVEEKAISKKLTEGFEDLPEYATVNIDAQAKAAANLIKTKLDDAIEIAKGNKLPPEGILPESVFVAVEEYALKNKNIKLLQELANSELSTQATGMGQRLRMLAERNPDSAVSNMQQVKKNRENAFEKQTGRKLSEAKKEEMRKIKQELNKSKPKKDEWLSFLEEIKCN